MVIPQAYHDPLFLNLSIYTISLKKYIHYSAIKEWNNAIFCNMDGPTDYHTKWSKSHRERQIPYDTTYMWNLKYDTGTSLVGQWLGVHLPGQGTRVWALVQEDHTCHRATGPVHHNYWAHVLQLLKPARLEPVLCNGRGHHNEKHVHLGEEWSLLAATRESPHAAARTQRSQK